MPPLLCSDMLCKQYLCQGFVPANPLPYGNIFTCMSVNDIMRLLRLVFMTTFIKWYINVFSV